MLNPLFYLQSILLALSQIWANKGRSFLTALGIIIGVASVTAVIAAMSGLKDKVLGELEAFGANKMYILYDWPGGRGSNEYSWDQVRMKLPELDAINEQCPSIKQLTPVTFLGGMVQAGTIQETGVNATAIWPSWHDIENRHILIGRPFNHNDIDKSRQVCLINDKAIAKLHLDTDPTNTHLLFNGRRYLIVGVVEDAPQNMFGNAGPDTTDVELLMPFTTAIKLQGGRFFFMIIAQLHSPEVADEAKAEVRFLLRKKRGLKAGEPDTFRIEAIDQAIEQFKAMAAGITAIAGGIVAISLLVGGIGIMNIMLVSVSERTREIGLRKAVGATPAAILMQFLLEAVTLCLLGGLAGLAIGEGFAFALTLIPDAGLEKAAIPGWAVTLSFAFSATVGIVFGMFPAIKASRLDPIDALRHE